MAGINPSHLSAGTALTMLAAFALHPIHAWRIATEKARGHRRRRGYGDTENAR